MHMTISPSKMTLKGDFKHDGVLGCRLAALFLLPLVELFLMTSAQHLQHHEFSSLLRYKRCYLFYTS